jgi:hypothetical protein
MLNLKVKVNVKISQNYSAEAFSLNPVVPFGYRL